METLETPKSPPVLTGVSLDNIAVKSGGGGKDQGIGVLTKSLLAEVVAIVDGRKVGYSYEEVLEKVREAKGQDRSSRECVVWYKAQIRKKNWAGWDVVVPKVRSDILLAAQQSDDSADTATATGDEQKPAETGTADAAITDPGEVAKAEKLAEQESDARLAKMAKVKAAAEKRNRRNRG